MIQPIPVLYLDHTAKLGGGEIALFNVVTNIDKKKYRPIVLLASEGPLVARLQAAGIETHILPLDPRIIDTRKDTLGAASVLKLRQSLTLLRYSVQIARWARRHGIRIIHCNSLKADLYGGLAGRLARIPTVWHIRDSINSEYLPPIIANVFRRLTHLVPTAVIANSESTRSFLSPKEDFATVVYSGVAQIVHDGLDPSGYLQAPRLPDPPVVSIVGRIAEWKGQDLFLRAAAETLKSFPETQFWIIGAPLFGEEEFERSLHKLVDELHIKNNVTFWGFREDIPDLLARTTILVHASRLGEPFGQVVIEAMAAAKPVIATNAGALPEIVLPEITALLVPKNTLLPIAESLSTLLADPERATAMGAAGRKRVQEKFTIADTARKIQRLYDNLLMGKTR